MSESTLKRCFKCGSELPLTEFYRHSGMNAGLMGKCKQCTRDDTRLNRAANKEYYRRYDQMRALDPKRVAAREAYMKSERGKANAEKARKMHEARAPFKKAAATMVGNALRDGKLTKGPCVVCGSAETDGHHFDYSRPLDVIWLCRHHHAAYHKIENEVQKRKAA